ncbi:hypothetical protein HELRODRAFT_79038 [Helobdella robusta]|uniref:CYTH domain-containing protein n=1 Tax=Helobdella robusta TaxID=6412 RepID=T1G3J0_HELRO|nr:hypothetical protein HELRODRAFT_79038 [Helobdella robusta]ESO04805.1 hypothetical protein HELRODRAFT_79038 [Helobdella robusta]
MIEIEKKFVVNDEILNKMLSLGAKLIKRESFTDVYYDTECHCLTTKNFWLRQRDEVWQLKSPTGHRTFEEGLFNSSYKETEKEDEIVNLIEPVLNQKYSQNQKCGLAEFLKLCNCQPFCKMTTHRQSYKLQDKFKIDLDVTDSGYAVGEIEMMINSETDIAEATNKIEDLSKKLELPITQAVSGKVSSFLKSNDPEHYKKLFNLKIIA